MSKTSMRIIEKSPILLEGDFEINIDFISQSVDRVNAKLRHLMAETEKMDLNIFQVTDFRMFSGLVGEALVSDMSGNHEGLMKNPNIDGYPDLLNASNPNYQNDIEEWINKSPEKFIKYPYGGVEVKNTFGVKKGGVVLAKGQTRMGKINSKLEWKAHHRYTNHLLALQSDYIDSCPQIVAVMYSDQLAESDWAVKQNPKTGSAMTSFSVTLRSGWDKLRQGLKLCRDDDRYLAFFGLGVP